MPIGLTGAGDPRADAKTPNCTDLVSFNCNYQTLVMQEILQTEE